jgi:beta-glucosidase-like glycosyl hydrolase
MHELLRSLSARRPVFHSEADFQHALAWEIQRASKSASIRLEQQIATHGSRVHLDLLVRDQSRHIAVELKYKTKKATLTCGEELFHLRNQSAQDVGRYDFLKDISRIERYVAAHPAAEGYVVLLTNDQSYWQESKKANTVDTAFRIHEDRQVSGELAWGSGASEGTMRSREAAIQITGSYCLTWHDFSVIEQQRFRYVLIHTPPA